MSYYPPPAPRRYLGAPPPPPGPMIRVIPRSSNARYEVEGSTPGGARRFMAANVQRAQHRISTLQSAMHAWSANPFRGRTVGWLPPEIVALLGELQIVPTIADSDMAAQARLKDVADQIVALADEWLALARGGKPNAAKPAAATKESF